MKSWAVMARSGSKIKVSPVDEADCSLGEMMTRTSSTAKLSSDLEPHRKTSERAASACCHVQDWSSSRSSRRPSRWVWTRLLPPHKRCNPCQQPTVDGGVFWMCAVKAAICSTAAGDKTQCIAVCYVVNTHTCVCEPVSQT